VKILIADDSAAALRILERAVTKLGHECITAADGVGAWDLFQQQGADVVISDWMMPGIEGDELCRRVRTCERYTYFILLSAHRDKKHILRGMEAGADDYLQKPLDRSDLETRLASATRVTETHRTLAAQQGELERLNGELHSQARLDALTGIGNRLAMREELEVLEARVERYGHTYGLALCDIDRFKAYNDACGHPAGDEILRTVAKTLAGTCRSGDAIYRYGGEELLIVLCNQTLDPAIVAGERFRETVEDLKIPHPGLETPGVLTISVGIAVLDKDHERGSTGLVAEADGALYRAKAAGRNCVVASRVGHGDREKCLASGMDDFLPKPVDPKALKDAIDRSLAGRPVASKPQAASEPKPPSHGRAPLIDHSMLEEICDGDANLRSELVGVFGVEAKTCLADIELAIQSGDGKVLVGQAHQLKGSAASMGAVRMAELSERLCQAGREGLPGDAPGLLEELEAASAETRAALQAAAPARRRAARRAGRAAGYWRRTRAGARAGRRRRGPRPPEIRGRM
jgi:two-component system cell cycle response regulator